tara:strand:- start:177 stop:308 length:132 start_codon:yes stop_codon:yes gene_type:complete
MKVKASVKKRSEDVKLLNEKEGFMLLIKRTLDINKDKDNYGKN